MLYVNYISVKIHVLKKQETSRNKSHLPLPALKSSFNTLTGRVLLLLFSRQVVSDSLRPHGLQPTGSSVHRIHQARILEWFAISYSRDLSDPRIGPVPPALAGGFFTTEPYKKNCTAQMQFAKYQLQQDKFEHRRVDLRPKANSLIIGIG